MAPTGRKPQETRRAVPEQRSTRPSGGNSPRSLTIIKELSALLGPYDYSEPEIRALATRCNYDSALIQAAVHNIIDDNLGHEPDIWATTATSSEKKVRAQEAKERRLEKEKAQTEEYELLKQQRTKDYDDKMRRLKEDIDRRKMEEEAQRLGGIKPSGQGAAAAANRSTANAWKRGDGSAGSAGAEEGGAAEVEVAIDMSAGEDEEDDSDDEEAEEEEDEEPAEESKAAPAASQPQQAVQAARPQQAAQGKTWVPVSASTRNNGLSECTSVTMPASFAELMATHGDVEVKFGTYHLLDSGTGPAASSTKPAQAVSPKPAQEEEEEEDAEEAAAEPEEQNGAGNGGRHGGQSWSRKQQDGEHDGGKSRGGKGKGRGKGWDNTWHDGGDEGKGEGKREGYKGKKGAGRGGKKGSGKSWRESGKEYREKGGK